MLSVNNISYKIGEKVLLNNINAEFLPGKLNIILGPNGAGKSTLIKLICKQLQPSKGNIFFDRKDIKNISSLSLSKIRSVLSQNIELAFPLKVWEVVMMGRYPHFISKPTGKDEEACKEAMSFFDVLEMAERDYTTLSGGEKQRVHFARVLSQIWYPIQDGNRFLIMDEPLTFLDVYYQYQFMEKTKSLLKNQDLVVVGVVHDLNLAARFADHILLLNYGEVLAQGTKEEVLTSKNIFETFKIEPVILENEKGIFLSF